MENMSSISHKGQGISLKVRITCLHQVDVGSIPNMPQVRFKCLDGVIWLTREIHALEIQVRFPVLGRDIAQW